MKRIIKKQSVTLLLCYKCIFFTPLTVHDTELLTAEIHTAKRHGLCGTDRTKMEFLESICFIFSHMTYILYSASWLVVEHL